MQAQHKSALQALSAHVSYPSAIYHDVSFEQQPAPASANTSHSPDAESTIEELRQQLDDEHSKTSRLQKDLTDAQQLLRDAAEGKSAVLSQAWTEQKLFCQAASDIELKDSQAELSDGAQETGSCCPPGFQR